MKVSSFFSNPVQMAKANAPEILTILGVSGVITTSYLTGKASFAANEVLAVTELETAPSENKRERFIERVRHVWPLYIPAGISGVITIGCIIGSSKASAKRTTAAVAAYSLTERAFSEYREKVVEQIGKAKEQKIRDEIAQDSVDKKPPTQVIYTSFGKVLCCELLTGRYFHSNMEDLRRAQNDVNHKIVNSLYVTLDEFYDHIGLDHTTNSGNLGWDSDRLMELQFSTVLTDKGEPCLAFEYNYTKPLR